MSRLPPPPRVPSSFGPAGAWGTEAVLERAAAERAELCTIRPGKIVQRSVDFRTTGVDK